MTLSLQSVQGKEISETNYNNCSSYHAIYKPSAVKNGDSRFGYKLTITPETTNVYHGSTIAHFVVKIWDNEKDEESATISLPWRCTGGSFGVCTASIPKARPTTIEVVALNEDYSRNFHLISQNSAPFLLIFPNANSKFYYSFTEKEEGDWYLPKVENAYYPKTDFSEVWVFDHCAE